MGYVLSRLDVNFLWIRLGWVRELVGRVGSGSKKNLFWWVGLGWVIGLVGCVGLGQRVGGLGWAGSVKNGHTDNSEAAGIAFCIVPIILCRRISRYFFHNQLGSNNDCWSKI
jgi:hypothetical protein